MTIVTKPLSEKKEGEKNQEPLVADVKLVMPDRLIGSDRVSSGRRLPPPVVVPPQVAYGKRRRFTSYLGFCFLVTLLFISIPLCANLLYSAARTGIYHDWCAVPYEEDGHVSSALVDSDPDSSAFTNANMLQFKKIFSDTRRKFFSEEFEIEDSVEKINVPDFSGGKRSRFVHDFRTNKTGIIDLQGRRCFVMPLNRSAVLPPNGLMDLIRKMNDGYYDVDTSILRENMRVVMPAIESRAGLGSYIMSECYNYPIYKLERVTSPVFKRSVGNEDKDDSAKFMSFAGKGTHLLNIINYSEVAEHEVDGPIAMA